MTSELPAQGYGDINADGTWKNDPYIYEWVVWFTDGTLIPQFNDMGKSQSWNDIVEYAENVSSIHAIGWLPFSIQKRDKINKINGDDTVVARAVGAHLMKCTGADPSEIFIRRRNAMTIPIAANAPPPKRETFYVMGRIRDKIGSVCYGEFIAVDSAGNTRLSDTSDVEVPVVPIRLHPEEKSEQ